MVFTILIVCAVKHHLRTFTEINNFRSCMMKTKRDKCRTETTVATSAVLLAAHRPLQRTHTPN